MPATKKTGKRIAIIGSGPAGLAVAQQLARAGHSVVVFEKDKQIGGLLRYGIPDFKLSKDIIDRRLEQLVAESIEFQTEMLVCRAQLLKRSSGATLLAILFFVVTSVLIGISFVMKVGFVTLTLITFLIGMVFILGGVSFAYWEMHISHNTIKEEIEASRSIVDNLLKKAKER